MVNLNPQTIAEIEECLRALLQPNNDVIKAATDKLNKLLKKSEYSLYLFHLLESSPYDEIKQLSAVLLRQKLVAHWTKFSVESRKYIKDSILKLVISQPSQLVRRSISEVIIIIARLEVATGTWADLFPFLLQLSSSPDTIVRQIQIHILDSLISNVDVFLKYFPQLPAVLSQAVIDPQLSVRALAVKAIGSSIYAVQTDSKLKPFIDLIPTTLQVIKNCIENEMEDDVISAFEIFNDLVESPYSSIKAHIPLIVNFSIEIVKQPEIDNSIKTIALEFLETCIKYQPKILKNSNLLNPILEILFKILTFESDSSIDENDYEYNIFQSASVAIKECGKSYSSKLIYYPILPTLKQFLESENVNYRNAVMIIIQQLSYGCIETMKDDLDNIIQFVLRGLKDQEKKVRQSACVTIGKLSQTLTPEIYKYTNQVFPLLFQQLSDPDDQFILRCCFALENFLLNLDSQELIPILPNVMDKMGLLIQRQNIQVKEFALSVLSAIAIAIEDKFEPYFNQVYQIAIELSKGANIQDAKYYLQVAQSFDLLAALINTIPKERFTPLIKELFTFIHDTVELVAGGKSSEIVESAFNFYSNAFELFGEEVGELLPPIYLQVFKSATSDDGVISNSAAGSGISGIDNEGEEQDIQDDEGEDSNGFSVRTSFLDEKSAALRCLAIMAKSLPNSYFPHIETTVQIIEPSAAYFHEDIREAALLTLQSLITPINHKFPPTTPWVKGDVQHQVSQQVRIILDFSFQIYNHIFEMETKKEVVARACGCIAQTIAQLGPGAVAPYLGDFGQSLLKIFNNSLYCQTYSSPDTNDEADVNNDDDDDDANEKADGDEDDGGNDDDNFDEDEDTEFQLIDMACECIIELANVIGQEFKLYLDASLPFLFKLSRSSTIHHSIKAVVIGTIAECFKLIGSDYSAYLPRILKFTWKALKNQDESAKVQRVCCFLLGVTLQNSIKATQDQYLQTLQLISPIIMKQDQDPLVLDNAIGCICRMIAGNQSFVPVATALPVLISKLPIQKDHEEIDPVLNALLVLFNTQFDLIAPHTQTIVQSLAPYMNKSKYPLKQTTFDKIQQIIHSLIAKFPDQMKQILSNIPEFQNIKF
ncbi:hypothetical protein ACTFIR_004052 [Dictyostelium discoideum]